MPDEYDDDENVVEGEPYWVRLGDITEDDVLPNEVWDHILDAVDEKCKAEDAERRQSALEEAKPKSKRRH